MPSLTRRPLQPDLLATYPRSRHVPCAVARVTPQARSQAPKSAPPRLKSFLEKTLIAHARPHFSHPHRLHSLLTRTATHPLEALPA